MTDQTNNKALARYERILQASNIDTDFAPMLCKAEETDPDGAARTLKSLIDHAATVKAMQSAEQPRQTDTQKTDNDMDQTRRTIEGVMLNGAGTAQTCLHPAADHNTEHRQEDEQTARLRRQIEKYMFSGIRA